MHEDKRLLKMVKKVVDFLEMTDHNYVYLHFIEEKFPDCDDAIDFLQHNGFVSIDNGMVQFNLEKKLSAAIKMCDAKLKEIGARRRDLWLDRLYKLAALGGLILGIINSCTK